MLPLQTVLRSALDKSATLTLQCKNFSTQHKFYLSDDINKCLLGLDFLLDNNAVLDTKSRVLIIDDKVIPLLAEPHFSGVNVYCADEIALAPLSETSVTCTKLPLKWCQYWGFQFFPAVRKTAFEIRSSSVQDDGTVILNVFNNTSDTMHVRKGRRLVHARPLTDCDSVIHVNNLDVQSVSPTEAEVTALCKRLKLHPEQFSMDQFQHITDLIAMYYDAFSINKEIGHAKVAPIHINFVNEAPVRSLPYRTTPADSAIINTLIDDMISKGLAKPADGRYSSPVCLVKQKGKHRLVVDYRNVNKSVELANKAYLPTIQSQLQKIPHGAILSSVDLVSAFWQFGIDDETSQRLAMATERGPFRPTRLPFGLVSSPSEMCAQMQKIMTGFPTDNLIQYMDDLVIFSTDLDKLIELTGDLLKTLL